MQLQYTHILHNENVYTVYIICAQDLMTLQREFLCSWAPGGLSATKVKSSAPHYSYSSDWATNFLSQNPVTRYELLCDGPRAL